MNEDDTTPGAGRIGRLAHRVAARHAAPSGMRGGLLGQAVAERRRPKLLDTLTRLAGPRSVGRKRAETAAVQPPPGMSDFAAAWMFGDTPVRGTPFAGGATVSDRERPSFLAPKEPAPVARQVARRPAPRAGDGPVEQTRPVVEELAPFRLARAPAEPTGAGACDPSAAGSGGRCCRAESRPRLPLRRAPRPGPSLLPPRIHSR